MKKIIYAWIAVALCTLCDAQFFYNDDQEQPTYVHNRPPVEVQQSNRPQRPTAYQPAPQAPQPVAAEYEQRPAPSRPRRRQSQIAQPQPPPRVYSPSVFQNLALGMPPAGVYVPDDSFLNVLRNDGHSSRARPAPVQELAPPQQTSFVQSPPAQQRQFVQPPPDRQTFVPAPPPRQPAFYQSPPAQSYSDEPAVSHRPRAIQPPPVVVPHQPPVQRPQSPVQRPQPVAVHSQVQDQAPYEPVEVPQQSAPRRRSPTRQRPVARAHSYEEPPQRPRVYSPSVFENLDLGIAPQGIYVPEDSLLNTLRNDRPVARSRRNQEYQLNPPAPLPARHPPAQPVAEQPAPIQTYSTNVEIPHEIHNSPPRAPRRVNRPPQQQRPQQEFVVDNAPNSQSVEEQPQPVQPPTPVQHRRRVSVRRHRQSSGTRPRQDPELEEISQPPKQYARSIFEKFALGEAPPGIYVPEDSFLNLLRGDVPVTRASHRPSNQGSRATQYAPPPPPPPQQYASDVSDVQNYPEPDYGVQRETPRRRSRISSTNQPPAPPPQQYQNVPPQQYIPPANAQPRRRPAVQEIQQPAIVPTPTQPPKRQRQRARAQQISAPQHQPVPEVSAVVYQEDPNTQQEDDILRYRTQRTQRQRVEPAPRYVPPPQPVYESPDPIYDTDSSFQQTDDIPRRRSQPSSQRRAQAQPQPVQRVYSSSSQVQPQHSEPMQQGRQRAAKLSVKPLPDDVDGDQIPGEAGIDYPTLHVIPRTSFSCAQQPHNGYYADLDTSCQVVHMCQAGGVQSSFLCPNGTIFNQEKFSCQWWYKVNCAEAPSHYGINDRLYKVPPPAEPSRRRNNK